jgi:hypothetical protein
VTSQREITASITLILYGYIFWWLFGRSLLPFIEKYIPVNYFFYLTEVNQETLSCIQDNKNMEVKYLALKAKLFRQDKELFLPVHFPINSFEA